MRCSYDRIRLREFRAAVVVVIIIITVAIVAATLNIQPLIRDFFLSRRLLRFLLHFTHCVNVPFFSLHFGSDLFMCIVSILCPRNNSPSTNAMVWCMRDMWQNLGLRRPIQYAHTKNRYNNVNDEMHTKSLIEFPLKNFARLLSFCPISNSSNVFTFQCTHTYTHTTTHFRFIRVPKSRADNLFAHIYFLVLSCLFTLDFFLFFFKEATTTKNSTDKRRREWMSLPIQHK